MKPDENKADILSLCTCYKTRFKYILCAFVQNKFLYFPQNKQYENTKETKGNHDSQLVIFDYSPSMSYHIQQSSVILQENSSIITSVCVTATKSMF